MHLSFGRSEQPEGRIPIAAAILDSGQLSVVSERGEATVLAAFRNGVYRFDESFADAFGAAEQQDSLFLSAGEQLEIRVGGRSGEAIDSHNLFELLTSADGVTIMAGVSNSAYWVPQGSSWYRPGAEEIGSRLIIAPEAYFAALPPAPAGPRQRLSALAAVR